MQKVKHFSSTIPPSVSDTIDPNSPLLLAHTTPTHETCKDWLEACNNNYSRKSVFFKGPLLYIDENIANLNTTSTMFSINAYKTRVKRYILEQQCSGDENDWLAENFLLYQISGLRKSNRPKNENGAAGDSAPRG